MTLTKEASMELKLPKDTFNFIYFIIFFLGLSGHLPWNAVLTAQPYFKARLSGSAFGSEFTAHFAIIFKTLKLAIFTAVSVAGLKINNKLWVGTAAIGNVLIFASFTGMVHEQTDSMSANYFYLITLSLVMAAGTFAAIFECGMYLILAAFPPHLTQSFMAGNAVGGILAALNLIISYFSSSANIYISTKLYFILSTLTFVGSLISFIVFLCTDYCKFYQKRLSLYTIISEVNNTGSDSTDLIFEPMLKKQASLIQDSNSKWYGESSVLIKKLWSENFALFMVGFVNLTIFPAIVSVTESVNANSKNASVFQRILFVPLAFLIVSTADFVGKMILSVRFIRKFDKLPFKAMSICRVLLIPLFLVGNIRINGKSLIFSNVLASDTIFFFLLTLAFVGGSYISTIIMLTAPKTKLEITERSRGTVLLCSAGLFGVFAGSVFSLFLKLFLRFFTK